MMTFFAIGVATDFRYAYWAVLAGLTGAVVVSVSYGAGWSRYRRGCQSAEKPLI
jgi:hypothetical protein